MKKHTSLKSKFNSAFSLVELLVVIAVIAVIAAIAIPNISGIVGSAGTASLQRSAQNLASVAASARAAGYAGQATKGAWITALTAGIEMPAPNGDTMTFRADGLPSDTTDLEAYIYADNNNLIYDSTGGAAGSP